MVMVCDICKDRVTFHFVHVLSVHNGSQIWRHPWRSNPFYDGCPWSWLGQLQCSCWRGVSGVFPLFTDFCWTFRKRRCCSYINCLYLLFCVDERALIIRTKMETKILLFRAHIISSSLQMNVCTIDSVQI